jgi:HlyD family secretion protein
VLVQLADTEARATLTQAQASLAEALARQHLQQTVTAPVAQATLNQATANLQATEAEHRRISTLVAQGFYSQQRLDDARRALDTARSAADAAQAQRQAQQPDGVETELSRNRLQQAQAGAEAAKARLQRLQLLAPFDGVVLARQAEPGALAQPGKALLSLGATHMMRIDLGVDERHLALLKPGMTALAVADAYPGQGFPARLDWVSPAVDATRGTVDVRLAVEHPPAFLRPDMTVSAELTVGRQQQVLVVDAGAVRDAEGTAPWVLVVRDGVAQKAPVTLGLRGVGQVEVTSGVAEGDVLIPATEKAAPGDRVRSGNTTAPALSMGMGR